MIRYLLLKFHILTRPRLNLAIILEFVIMFHLKKLKITLFVKGESFGFSFNFILFSFTSLVILINVIYNIGAI